MENVLLNINTELTKGEYFAYFLPEILYIVGIVANLILYVFRKRKESASRHSDFLTSVVLIVNAIALFALSVKNYISIDDVNFNFAKKVFYYNNDLMMLKAFIALFGLFYLFSMYKIIRKTRIKTSLLNALLLFILFATNFMLYSVTFLMTYLLLETIIFLLYQYGSSTRVKKDGLYSPDFLSVNLSASILFIAFLLVALFVKDETQQVVVNSCLMLSILLKIGIFPFYNYLVDENIKTNIPYATMLNSYLPLVGVICFAKLVQNFDFFNDVYQISLSVFVLMSLVLFAIFALRQKNILKILSGISYFCLSFSILNILFMGSIQTSVNYILAISFVFLAINSLLAALKLNINPDKMLVETFKGIFFKNRLFAILFAVSFLIALGLLPSLILNFNISILNDIYVFDKIGIFALVCVIFAQMLIMFKVFDIVRICYSFDRNNFVNKLTKRTTLNYVVPVVIIIFLIVGFIL